MKWPLILIVSLTVIACRPALAQERAAGQSILASQPGASPSSFLPARPLASQGELAVTLTVVPSVGIVMDENGQPRLIVANAADPADNISSLSTIESVHKPGSQLKSKQAKRR